MYKAGPEPEVVFSLAQWTAIAKAISLGSPLPLKDKKDICIAILAYDLARLDNEKTASKTSKKSIRRRVDPRAKGRAALSNFIKYSRGLRHALDTMWAYLKTEELINQAEDLTDKIYAFQKLAQHALDKKGVGGRPDQQIRDNLVCRLAVIYKRLTGRPPTRIVDRNGKVRGEFTQFVYTIFEAQEISTIGLPNAIAKAVGYAKNLQ